MHISRVPLENILLFILLFLGTLALSNMLYLLARRALDNRFSTAFSKGLAHSVQYSVFVAGMYIGIYHVLHLDFKALAASLGVISLAVAFSAQQLIQNLIAGILISMRGIIRFEDWVEIGASGICRVKDISVTHTVLRGTNGKLSYLSNSVLLSSSLINYSKSGFIEVPVQLSFPVMYDHEKVKEIALLVADSHAMILPEVGKEKKQVLSMLFSHPGIHKMFGTTMTMEDFKPKVYLTDISAGRVTLSIRLWIHEINSREEIVSEYLSALLKRLREEGMEPA